MNGASVIETHSGVVFFYGDRAYKLKKAVDLGFLDFTDRAVRRAVCHREVELNRRLAPDVYLGVADVIGPGGDPWDHLVVMRRLPDERRLATMVAAGQDVACEVRRLARRLAVFHAAAARSPVIDAAGGIERLLEHWAGNTAVLRSHIGSVLDVDDVERAARLSERYLEGRRRLLAHRVERGRIVDGHGDLLAEDIFCLPDGPRVLDCLEFDDRLRYGDVLADVAFLAMDLEHLGAPRAAEDLLSRYRRLTNDDWPASLVDHDVAYRAHVRAKVSCLRFDQGGERAGGDARDLLALAVRHLERARVRLVLVGGLPGTGKTTLASMLGDELVWVVLSSDEIRKELAGVPSDRPVPVAFGEGLYRAERTVATYRTMLERARTALGLGQSVILDASWLDPCRRVEAVAVAHETSSDVTQLRCELPTELAATRLRTRLASERGASDATPEVLAAMAAVAPGWPSARSVHTEGDPSSVLAAALAELR